MSFQLEKRDVQWLTVCLQRQLFRKLFMCTEIDKHCEIGHKRLLMSSIETENQHSHCGSTIGLKSGVPVCLVKYENLPYPNFDSNYRKKLSILVI